MAAKTQKETIARSQKHSSLEDDKLQPISNDSHGETEESYLVESWHDDHEYSKLQSPRHPYFKKQVIKHNHVDKEKSASKA